MNIVIVDNYDQPIGVKERNDLDYLIDIYRVSALWLTNSNGQVLLAKRAATKDKDPSKWGPAVAGTLEADETYESNIYKEAIEEIGLEGVSFTLGPKCHFTNPRNYFCQWYLAVVDKDISDFTRQVLEVDELAWIDTSQLLEELRTMPDKYIPSMPQLAVDLELKSIT